MKTKMKAISKLFNSCALICTKNCNKSATVKFISNSKIISIDFYLAIHKRSVSKISLLMTIKFWPKIQFDLIASMRDCRLMKWVKKKKKINKKRQRKKKHNLVQQKSLAVIKFQQRKSRKNDIQLVRLNIQRLKWKK